MIKLDYQNQSPIHEQITLGIKELIITGALKKDEQLPSVRELSVELTVNPNTVQRAYKTLESQGIIYSVRGKGNFVAEVKNIAKEQITEIYDALEKNIAELKFLGESEEKINSFIHEIYKEGEKK